MKPEEFLKEASKRHLPYKSVSSTNDEILFIVHTIDNGRKQVKVVEESKDGISEFEFMDTPGSNFFENYRKDLTEFSTPVIPISRTLRNTFV